MSRRRTGFTLIELLVVIAIIAIITAILVPVFFNAKEGGRQGTVMSNLKQISTGLERYHLEFHQYPQVLFGYAVAGKPMNTLVPAPGAGTYPPGLYPSYVKTADVFQDPNNTADPADPSATVMVSGKTFYAADAFDINPAVTGSNTLLTPQVAASSPVRYNRTWTTTTTDPDYARQLSNPNPPENTYITCTTYHVPNRDQVMILFENGSVKKMTGADFAAQESNFWKVKP